MNRLTHKIEITFGVSLDKNMNRIPRGTAGSAVHDITKVAMGLFGGYTIINTEGGWRDDGWRVFKENGRLLTVHANIAKIPDLHARATALCDTIKTRLNQASVLLTISRVDSRIV